MRTTLIKPLFGTRIDYSNPISRDIIYAAPFSEGAGDSTFDFCNYNHSALSNTTWSQQKHGHAISLNGSTSEINVGQPPILGNMWSGGASMLVRLFISSAGGAGQGRIADKTGWLIVTVASGPNIRIIFLNSFSGTPGQWSMIGSFATSFFLQFVLTYNSDSVTNNPLMYLTDLQVTLSEDSTPVGTSADDSANNLYLGNRAGNDRGLHGFMSDCIIWKRILSFEEIRYLNTFPHLMYLLNIRLPGRRPVYRTPSRLAYDRGLFRGTGSGIMRGIA